MLSLAGLLRCEGFGFISIFTPFGMSLRFGQLVSRPIVLRILKLLLSNQQGDPHHASMAAPPQDAQHGTRHSMRTSIEDPDQPRQLAPLCSA